MTRLQVRVSPSARRSEAWLENGEIRIRVAAPPVEGKANAELIAFLARALGLPRSRITLMRGSTSRYKAVEIDGLDRDQILTRLVPDPKAAPVD